ncbi:hypothetical protein, partial [Rappaport israeli]|uniref:hypothetical protein n=1 Tax=Rappaport israeli TaxID=1839807 RepID=UPI0013011F41
MRIAVCGLRFAWMLSKAEVLLMAVCFVYSRRIEKVLRRWLALPYYLYCLRLAALYYFFTSPTISACCLCLGLRCHNLATTKAKPKTKDQRPKTKDQRPNQN